MSKEYKYTFTELIEKMNMIKLGTIIESDYGNRYKLTKTDMNIRKFSRVNKGLRFMTYDNMDRFFRIVEEQQDIDIQKLEDIKDVFIKNATCGEDVKYLARKYNELVQAVKQLDRKIKDKE